MTAAGGVIIIGTGGNVGSGGNLGSGGAVLGSGGNLGDGGTSSTGGTNGSGGIGRRRDGRSVGQRWCAWYRRHGAA